jgi:hypothetical protein
MVVRHCLYATTANSHHGQLPALRLNRDAADQNGGRGMTGAPPSIRKYFYWSDRRITRIAQDGGIDLQRPGSTKLKTPTAPLLPVVELDRPRRPLSRPETAELIERYLSGVTVRDFVTPPPVRFAAGCGTLVFAEFMNYGRIENTVSIYTRSLASDGSRVAIGMFGSKDNLAEVIATSPTTQSGWSSSAAGEIFSFVNSFGRPNHTFDREDLAREAVNLLAHQGGDLGQGTKRGFTYGHIGEYGEWLLEAHLDVEFPDHPIETHDGSFDRIIIGAPLWIRTPSPQALVLYHDSNDRAAPQKSKTSWWRRVLG